MSALLLFLKRIPPTVYLGALVAALLVGATHAASNWYEHRLAREWKAGADSVNALAVDRTAQYQADSARLQAAYTAARDSAIKVAHVAEVRARSNAATDRLYASLKQLSAPAQADSSVAHLEAAARQVAAELDSTKRDVVSLIETAAAERSASDSVHALDAQAIHAQAVVIGAKDDTIRLVRAERDRRVKKSTVVKIAGTALGTGYAIAKWVVPLISKGN